MFNKLSSVRKKAKVVSYSAMYGVGKAKLARTTGMSELEAGKLLDAFWKINWTVKATADEALKTVRTVDDQMWILNPVSGFWYSLRYEKDAWSTINQGTGVYCFDNWLAFYLSRRPNICGQFHDESINRVPKGEEKEHEEVLRWAIKKVNEKLQLNIDLDVDVKFGTTYAEIH